ncbi:hypothetical protein EKO23_10020 [Nocardioides guangzhouensis]|uniref:Uncharacterized protein n=1 Tax=Nocardioides guangzhouensis TaxID=2497878 RepID=A0A4Q4ZDU9_9ACTN|nr:DUF6191 domain-containing protein [Nocardioides guangzhouensis]RYP86280.1 hypothetical protein EKO23_10020 [Nocardioides guangzhouensis]
MTSGMLVALTFPGLVVLLLALAIVEQPASRLRRRSVVTRRRRTSRTATGLDFMTVLTMPDKQIELDQRASDKVRRVGSEDDAPADGHRVALDAGTVRITRR